MGIVIWLLANIAFGAIVSTITREATDPIGTSLLVLGSWGVFNIGLLIWLW